MTTAHPRGQALGRGFQPLAAPADVPALPLADHAAPGVEELADTVAEGACALVDIVTPSGWSAAAVEDALDAIETLAAGLTALDPPAARLLAPIQAATAALRQRMQPPSSAAEAVPPPRRRRRSLGHGAPPSQG
ncbi:hypothetical protein M1P56_35785 (plasmid) [Streptomyces sp. HU2014]|uniref:hypothetical protein n=1 Tax=Streptomyces sp. HU2014 TaxID=2939414 RepID=UPI00200C7993|nr:hypothetical protein [Streptomyces sp. HU2014]UQI49852.1 hypothetical protein M1P56_35785 [Streptomyces sp. HU2014]